ncbi:MAG: hypothetical protein ACRENE_00750 [Polyangiaceae bacterium]
MRQTHLALATVVLAWACSLPHPPLSAQATTALTLVDSDPPPGRVESVPPRPSGADAWINGEWVLRRGRWSWLLGRWVKTPPGATYAPWVAVRAIDGTLYYAPSGWHDATGTVIAAPPALSYATAYGGGIVTPDGQLEPTGRAIRTAPPLPLQPIPAP